MRKQKSKRIMFVMLILGILLPLGTIAAVTYDFGINIGQDVVYEASDRVFNPYKKHDLVLKAYSFKGYSDVFMGLTLQRKLGSLYYAAATNVADMDRTGVSYPYAFGSNNPTGTYRYVYNTTSSQGFHGGFDGLATMYGT